MNIINKIVSERSVLLLVLLGLVGMVIASELIGVSLTDFGETLVLMVVAFFFGQSSPSKGDVDDIG